jgi:hypothetical protein
MTINKKHILRLIKKHFPESDNTEINNQWLDYCIKHGGVSPMHMFTLLNMMDYYATELAVKPNKEMQRKLDAIRWVVGEWLG